MTKTKYWASVVAISAVLVAGLLAVNPVAFAEDDDDDGDGDTNGSSVSDFLPTMQLRGSGTMNCSDGSQHQESRGGQARP